MRKRGGNDGKNPGYGKMKNQFDKAQKIK